MKRWIPFMVLGALAGALTLSGCNALGNGNPTVDAVARPAAADPATDRATVTGNGTASIAGTPNVMSLSLGVETKADSAGEAPTRNNELANKLIATLKGAGVADADIQTSQLSLYPGGDNNGQPDGFVVNNAVTAKIRDLKAAPAVIDTATQAVGDGVRFNGVWFEIDDTSKLTEQARGEAVKRARAQAEQLAAAAGVELDAIVSIEEINPQTGPILDFAGARTAAQDAASAPIEPGSQELSVNVTVVYTIK